MTARFVYVARHAWAYDFGDPRWPDDSARPLEPEGIDRYVRVVAALAERGFSPAAIATSPYERCRQTAEIIAEHTPNNPQVTTLDALYSGSDFEALCDWSRAIDSKQVCWVGHAPDVGFLTAALIGDPRTDIRFAKGAVAAVRLHTKVGYGCGELHWLTTAKSLGL